MIAKTILQQIGGKRFTAMTGSRDFIDMGNGLRMSLARNKTSANRLDIIYDEGADLYNMRFYRRTFSKKTFECKTKDIAVHEGIYFDMLEEMFTMVTGLYINHTSTTYWDWHITRLQQIYQIVSMFYHSKIVLK